MTFKIKKAFGDIHEIEAGKRIEKLKNVKIIRIQDETNYKIMHHDFTTDDGLKYEVKAEPMSNITGNLFIEFLDSRKKISGIALSDADFYIFFTHNLYLLIPIEQLKELTKINNITRRAKDSTLGYIIKWEIIKNCSIII